MFVAACVPPVFFWGRSAQRDAKRHACVLSGHARAIRRSARLARWLRTPTEVGGGALGTKRAHSSPAPPNCPRAMHRFESANSVTASSQCRRAGVLSLAFVVESGSCGPKPERPGLVAMGTDIEPVPVTGLAANFSPMPRMAPPPLGNWIVGVEASELEGDGWPWSAGERCASSDLIGRPRRRHRQGSWSRSGSATLSGRCQVRHGAQAESSLRRVPKVRVRRKLARHYLSPLQLNLWTALN